MATIDDRLQGQYEPNQMWLDLVNMQHEASQIQNHYDKAMREIRETRPFTTRETFAEYRARMEQLCNAATGKIYKNST